MTRWITAGTYVVALDMAGAFDRVWHKGLILKLQAMGVRGKLTALLRVYWYNKTLS